MATDTEINRSIVDKITNAPENTYIIFYVPECPYCQKALQLLRNSNVSYKGYNIHQIKGNMSKLLEVLNNNHTLINFNPNHKTKPIIFLNGKFIGGFDDLSRHFKTLSKN